LVTWNKSIETLFFSIPSRQFLGFSQLFIPGVPILFAGGLAAKVWSWPLTEVKIEWSYTSFFLKIFIAQTVYTVCTRLNYKIFPVTNLNKYFHYGTSFIFFLAKQPSPPPPPPTPLPVGQGLLILEVTWLHTTTLHSR